MITEPSGLAVQGSFVMNVMLEVKSESVFVCVDND